MNQDDVFLPPGSGRRRFSSNWHCVSCKPGASRSAHCHVEAKCRLICARGFTLVEMLAVMGVIILILALIVPAFVGVLGNRSVTSAAYQIAGVLEQARTYALANHTYVWVGFVEENEAATSGSSPTPLPVPNQADPGGRVVISVVASLDGSRYSDATVDASNPAAFSTTPFGTLPASNQVKLVQINKLVKIDNVHMGSSVNGVSLNDGLATGSSNNPTRPPVGTDYQVGNPTFAKHATDQNSTASQQNVTTFNYPLIGTAQYTFYKTIEFNPQGEASKIVDSIDSGPQKWLEIGLQPTHGSTVSAQYAGANDAKAAAVIMVEGNSGRVEIVRP